MKRFLILFSLIAFVTVSFAGPNKKVRAFTKPNFSQDEYDKDRDECFAQSIEQNQDSDARSIVNCLENKGYEFKKAEEPPKEPPSAKEVLVGVGVIALVIVLSPLILAYGVLLVGSAP